MSSVRDLLFPRSIAVIGASRDPRSVGGALFRNLLKGSFTGPIFPVNPHAASVEGVLAYPSILDVPGEVDLAVIVISAAHVLDAVDQCARKGVPGLLVVSAGFGETDEEGKRRERELRDKVRSHGMRLIGPNCLGILNTNEAISMNATFSPAMPPRGRVSMASQSGALGLALLDYAASYELGVAQFVSMGNRVDVSSNDLLEFWEGDPDTDVILLYLESFGNPRKFSRIARRVSASKPIIAVKGGRSAVGARAATSHTGALAAADVAVDALFHKAGIVRVETIEEMLGVAQILAYQPLPRGGRVAIVTNAGGPGILAADACESRGLPVPPLSEETQAALRSFLPPQASVRNPVDMIASASPEQYRRTIGALLSDRGVDVLLVIYIPPLVTQPEDIAAALRQAVVESPGDKPVVSCFMMSRGTPVDLRLGPGRQIPSFVFPEDAVAALAHACDHADYRARPEGRAPVFPDARRDDARALVRRWLDENLEGGWLPPEQAMALVGTYGIPAVETDVATSEEEAVRRAAEVGFPAAMKVRSTTIVHKTDIGGVALRLRSAEEVRQAYRRMAASVRDAGRGEEMTGVVLQRMAPEGLEMIVGMSHDPLFGPLVMVGLGGVLVEVTKDVSFSLHPLTDRDADDMLHQLKGYPLLQGWRGHPPRDVEALKDALLRFSALVADLPEMDQVEMNPLVVFEQGLGCSAVDARVLVRPAPPGAPDAS